MSSKALKRKALGRGLSALIPVEEEAATERSGAEQVDISAITPNPFQPRTEFNQEEIDNLAASIKNQGLLQPIVVRKKMGGYEIVSGERRFRAMKQLGWDQVPALVKTQVSDREMLEMALVENIQREQLNEIEQANAFQRLLLDCNLSHEQLSERVGKSRSTITNTLRLLKLPSVIQQMIQSGQISGGHARALLSLDDVALVKQLAERIRTEGLSVRQIEEAARGAKGAPAPQPRKPRAGAAPAPQLDADTAHVLEQLQYRYGTSVRLNGTAQRGRIEITFSDTVDLNRILTLMLPAAS